MSQFDRVLKLYADNGMRTAEDWATLGRDLKEGAKPCTEADYRGKNLELYTRDQTQMRAVSRVATTVE